MLVDSKYSHWPGCRHFPARFLVVIGGVERKAHCFVIDLPHSDGCFVKAYPSETTEAFLDGHVAAFAFLGGVPQSILYDNTRLAVAKILGDGRRQRTRAFTELQSHYLFEDRFGRPGKGNDKGKVEGLVGYVRRNFLVPVPSFESFDALNAYLERRLFSVNYFCRFRRLFLPVHLLCPTPLLCHSGAVAGDVEFQDD